jgi:chromosome segregation ATPase
MSYETIIDIVKWVGGTVVALLSTGGVVKVVEYFSNRPESQAKAKVQNVTAETTLGEGWRAYAEKSEERFDKLEEKYQKQIEGLEGRITSLQDQIATERTLHAEVIRQKDVEIEGLKQSNRLLAEQNTILESKLKDCLPPTAQKIEEAKQHLHDTVEHTMEDIKPHDEDVAKVL